MFHPDPNAPPPPIVGQILEVVKQAKAQLQPARMGFAPASLLQRKPRRDRSTARLWTQGPNLSLDHQIRRLLS